MAQALFAEQCKDIDILISTALIPGEGPLHCISSLTRQLPEHIVCCALISTKPARQHGRMCSLPPI